MSQHARNNPDLPPVFSIFDEDRPRKYLEGEQLRQALATDKSIIDAQNAKADAEAALAKIKPVGVQLAKFTPTAFERQLYTQQ